MEQAWRPKLQNKWIVWKEMEIEIQGITNLGVLKEAFWGCWSPELAAGPGTAGEGPSRCCHTGVGLCKQRLIRAFWRENRWELELGAMFAASRFHIPNRSLEGWGWVEFEASHVVPSLLWLWQGSEGWAVPAAESAEMIKSIEIKEV